MTVHIGTSGWQYRSWRDGFYPPKLPLKDWLVFYAGAFGCVEVNNSFYRLPKAATFAEWKREVPSDFRFAAKVSRYLTHMKRLRDPEEPVQRFLEHAKPLDGRTGPLLLQLPPTMRIDLARLEATLTQFPKRYDVALEVRHPSWFTDECKALLAEHNVALVLSDRRGKMQEPLWRTAGWGYIRLHEGNGRPHPGYRPAALREWAQRIADTWSARDDVWVFFNNDGCCCAVRDAVRFADACDRAGLPKTRVPEPDSVHLTCYSHTPHGV
jgi:uncharacterized protein YecE (DUF72 family)